MRLRRGQEVRVAFWDHCEDGGEPIHCSVPGRVYSAGRKYVVLVGWEEHEVIPDDTDDQNFKFWVILRSTITDIWWMKPHEHKQYGRKAKKPAEAKEAREQDTQRGNG